jgi:hypothetical protein
VIVYDLALMWDWEHDGGFVAAIRDLAEAAGLSLLEIRADTVDGDFARYKRDETRFRFLFDRASDSNDRFTPFARHLLGQFRSGTTPAPWIFNPQDLQHRAADKATMHLEFLSGGILVPYTIIISPYNHRRELELSLSELEKLDRPFIIKPANTSGGGVGVVMGAETLKHILEARQLHKNDKYLLQETINPAVIDGKRAWFRVFYAFGEVIPCWWDETTHIYLPAEGPVEGGLDIAELEGAARRIQRVCGLDFFSTEIALTEDGRYVSVDYVNEVCDMRLQSICPDGVPDAVVRRIAALLVESAARP